MGRVPVAHMARQLTYLCRESLPLSLSVPALPGPPPAHFTQAMPNPPLEGSQPGLNIEIQIITGVQDPPEMVEPESLGEPRYWHSFQSPLGDFQLWLGLASICRGSFL